MAKTAVAGGQHNTSSAKRQPAVQRLTKWPDKSGQRLIDQLAQGSYVGYPLLKSVEFTLE
jgi:hypothetical protein